MYQILDEVSELVYIADLETYELLFLNKPGRQLFGIQEIHGQKCYQALQNRESPCEFCTNRKLKPGEFYTWTFENTITKRHYLLKDQLTNWNGRIARLEIAFDMTEYEEHKLALQSVIAMEAHLLNCIKKLNSKRNLKESMQEILEEIGTYLGAERMYLFEICTETETMNNTYEWCSPGVTPQILFLQEMDVHLIDRWLPYFLEQKCVIIEEVKQLKDQFPEEYEILHAQGIRSLAAVPLEMDGTLIGYIGVDNSPINKWENISTLLNTLGYFIVSQMQNEEKEKRLMRLSYYDTLTGIFNRNRFMDDLEQIKNQTEKAIGVIYIDINGLKEINDQYGHMHGDQMIASAVQKIQTVFPDELIYRVGGDEFVVLTHMDEETFNHRVRDLKNQFWLSSEVYASVGYAWSESAADVQKQVMLADEMMYSDKKQFYRNHPVSSRYRHYNDELLDLMMPGILKHKIEKNRFLIYYQPKISAVDRTLIGAEALIRYLVKKETIMPPDQLIPALEEARLIWMIDFYVFDAVCKQIAVWLKNGEKVVPVSVNFSRYTLLEIGFIKYLQSIWEKHSIPQHLVEIEITESGESENNTQILQVLKEVKALGFKISIDDFGAKYANLSLFTSIDFDVLKIDKSLISTLGDNERTSSLIAFLAQLCQTLDVQLIAEGVETEVQFLKLQKLGCQGVQGYLFSRPLPLDVFEQKYIHADSN